MVRVLVNGYGTVGKRIADAIPLQEDLSLAGVVHMDPDHHATLALRRGFDLYATNKAQLPRFEEQGLAVAGTLDDALAACDLVIDATPSGVGAENKQRYEAAGLPAIFQGGEEASLTGVSFNARHSYEKARGQDYARVVSCNTTGLARSLGTLAETFGGVEDASAVLVRRAADPHESKKGPIDAIVPETHIPSHHGPDLATVCPDVQLRSMAVKVPATHMHLHTVTARFPSQPSAAEVQAVLADERRIWTVPGGCNLGSTASLIEFARDALRPRNDLWELAVWEESLDVDGPWVSWIQAVHQEAIVVPENIDCVRAMLELAPRDESMERTDASLGVGTFGPGLTGSSIATAWDPPSVA